MSQLFVDDKREKTKLTIEADKEEWERFKRIAKYNHSTATAQINLFIKEYLTKNSQLVFKD